jgi:hypothetical protein
MALLLQPSPGNSFADGLKTFYADLAMTDLTSINAEATTTRAAFAISMLEISSAG